MAEGRGLSTDSSCLPGYWALLWLLFMQPVMLHRRLRHCGIEGPGDSAWRLWRLRDESRDIRRSYVRRMFALLISATPLFAIAVSLILHMVGFEINPAGVAVGVAVGVAGGVAGGVTVIRLPLYPLEALIQILLYFLVSNNREIATLRYSPVLFHDLSYVPYPFLVRHIVLTAERDPALVRRVLEACAIAPGQRRAGRTALARLQARELTALGRNNRFEDAVQLEGQWLPGVEGADPMLLAFRETARYLLAADNAGNPHHQMEHLKRAQKNWRLLKTNSLEAPDLSPQPCMRPCGAGKKSSVKRAPGRWPFPPPSCRTPFTPASRSRRSRAWRCSVAARN